MSFLKKLNKICASAFLLGALCAFGNAYGAEKTSNPEHAKTSNHASHAKGHAHVNHHEHHHAKHVDAKENESIYGKPCCKKGMVFGFGGNFSGGIHSNDDFRLNTQNILNTNFTDTLAGANVSTKELVFDQKFDQGYGAYAQLGWMLNNCLEITGEVGYNQLKNKDRNHSQNRIESDIWSGMLNLNYYLNLLKGRFLPYVGLGMGFARIHADGHLYQNFYDADQKNDYSMQVSFRDLEKVTFAYQAGLGVATYVSSNAMVGAGYKYFATRGIDQNDDDLNAKVSLYQNGQQVCEVNNIHQIDFGSLKHENHMLNVFVKFVF